MKALILAVLLPFGFWTDANAQSVKLEKLPAKKVASPAAKSKTPKRATASTKKPSKPKGKKRERATIKSKGSTLGQKTKTLLPVKAAGEAQKKKETLFKRRKKPPKKK